MSKFDLRDISDRLTRSRDTEAVVFEFLGYLQSMRPDWRGTLAFYEVSRDALVSTYERRGNRLVRRDLVLPVDQLPARLVRKFFHPSAFFNQADRRSLFSHVVGASPSYAPDPLEAPALAPLAPIHGWQSCVCLPLADAEDVIALLVLASEKRGAFGSREIGEIIPVKSIAALALAQHLYRATRARDIPATPQELPAAAAEFHDRIQRLNAHAEELAEENRAKSQQLERLAQEIEQLDRNSSQYRQELERVKGTLFALEEQSSSATAELHHAQTHASGLQRTVTFMREACSVLTQEHDPERFPQTLVGWFAEHFGVERCSLMLYDSARESLVIVAQRGMDPDLVPRVRVRLGQGIAGWVAHNRKPLFVRVREDAEGVRHTDREAYNSDSFVSAPLVYNNRLIGVLNLSNKHASQPFEELDLDRAVLAGTLMATVLGAQDTARRAAAWR